MTGITVSESSAATHAAQNGRDARTPASNFGDPSQCRCGRWRVRPRLREGLSYLLNGDIKANKEKASSEQLAKARDYQRRGQFMIDFIMSENSMGFHAPQEAERILGEAINLCRLGQIALHGGPEPDHKPPAAARLVVKAQAQSGK